MREGTIERARELGWLLGQTEEYQALARARRALAEDRELTTLLNRLAELDSRMARSLERGEAPAAEDQTEYEESFNKLQASPVYQALVAAQSNFERVLKRVNDEIARGIEAGAQSRIILPS
ncbi:MAG: YlbF family regulator [bacterium]|jgi:cell fate (sporulation/competence/biofilm development) regulator YlbF (YheA/YmcA/DUF963 family)|nr:MAG: hypothetical protein DIU52_13265 [bacterium]